MAYNVDVIGHRISMAVWGVAGPVTAGSSLTVKVGAKCTRGCSLAGQQISVAGQDREVRGRLSETLWEGTRLYWTEVRVSVPTGALGGMVWNATLKSDHKLFPEHKHAGYRFSAFAVPSARRELKVRLLGLPGAMPLSRAHIRVGPYHAMTDEEGCAALRVHPGAYTLTALHRIHYPVVQEVEVWESAEVTLTTELVPDTDPRYVPHHWG